MRVLAIAGNTFREAVRDRVLYNLILFALLLIGAAVLFGTISVGIESTIMVTLGLSSISVFGLFMAIFIGIGLVSKEIDRKTLYNILSKPVARYEFILGKYLGLLATLLVNTSIMTVGYFLALLYVNKQLSRHDLLGLEAIYFILLQLSLVTAVALFFSCISTPVLSSLFTFLIFIIGNVSGNIRWFGEASGSKAVEWLAAALYYVLPNFSNFNVITSVAHRQEIPVYLFEANSLYTLLYVTLLLAGSVLIFEEREFI